MGGLNYFMSLTESIAAAASLAWFGEQGGERVKSEIGRVKSWRAFPISLFTIHSSPSLVALCAMLLPTLRSRGED